MSYLCMYNFRHKRQKTLTSEKVINVPIGRVDSGPWCRRVSHVTGHWGGEKGSVRGKKFLIGAFASRISD